MPSAIYIDRNTHEAVRTSGIAWAAALKRVAAGFGRPAALETTSGGW